MRRQKSRYLLKMQKKFFKKQMISFREKVFRIVRRIPKGKTMSYKQVAFLAGKPRAWRIAGNILNQNQNSKIPCHRVIKADGRVGGYRYGIKKKIALLKKEGVVVKKRGVVPSKKTRIVITDENE
jgi:O-6-methylguanine DNA methyltransferase